MRKLAIGIVIIYLILITAIAATAEENKGGVTSVGKSVIENFCKWATPSNQPAVSDECISTAAIGQKCDTIESCAALGYYPVYGMNFKTDCPYTDRFENGKIQRECLEGGLKGNSWLAARTTGGSARASAWAASRDAEPPGDDIVTAAGGPLLVGQVDWAATRYAEPPENIVTSAGKSTIEYFCQWKAFNNDTGQSINCIHTGKIGNVCGTIQECRDLGYYPVYGMKFKTDCSYSEEVDLKKKSIRRTCVDVNEG